MKQEEIEQVAKEWAEDSVERVLVPNVVDYMRWAYESGAKWAEKSMIDKACEWLLTHIDKDLVIYHEQSWKSLEQLVKDFKKAMEE